MSVVVSYKKQFTFFLLLFIITLIIIEISVRTIDIFEISCFGIKSPLFDNYTTLEKRIMCDEYNSIEYDYTTPFRMLIPNQEGNYVHINSDGFRGDEINFDDNYKIFFLGGSTGFGIVSSSDETTIPGFIQKKINEDKLDAIIINAATPEAATVDQLYILKEKILKFNPDMIIMYEGWNDVMLVDSLKFNLSYEEYLKNNYWENKEILSLDFQNKPLIKIINSNIIFLLHRIDYKTGIGIITFLGNQVKSNLDISHEKFSPTILAKIEDNISKNWSKVCELGEKHGFQTVNIIQPILGTSDRVLHFDEKIILSIETGNFGESALQYVKNLNIKDKLQYCKNVFDLRNTLTEMNEELIYFDRAHMNDIGNKIIAEKIYEKVLPLVMKDMQK